MLQLELAGVQLTTCHIPFHAYHRLQGSIDGGGAGDGPGGGAGVGGLLREIDQALREGAGAHALDEEVAARVAGRGR